MNYFELAYTTPETLEKIKAAEDRGEYNGHLDPITSEGSLPVTEKFAFRPNPVLRFVYWCRRTFWLNQFTKTLNEKYFHTKVTGLENIKKVKGAVYICNHINKFDALAVNYATKHIPLKIMVADFNNRDGMLGRLMRADGILPFKNDRKIIHKFTESVNWYLTHGTGVLFFPEGSEWWCYKKPRPFMDGAFHFASSNNVPVVPIFITFTDSNVDSGTGVNLPNFTVNILTPIYPDGAKSKAENTKMLKDESFYAWVKKYEEFYGIKYEL